MTSGCVRLVAVAVTLIATLTTTAIAQEPVVRDSADYRQVLSANPLGLILLPAMEADSIVSTPHSGITRTAQLSKDFI